MEASVTADVGGHVRACNRGWRTRAARRMHDQIGYAFRKVKPLATQSGCWDDGALLFAKATAWSKALDWQLPVSTNLEEKEDEKEQRTKLAVHHSDASTAFVCKSICMEKTLKSCLQII